MILPPKNFRKCGDPWRNDEYWVETAKLEAQRLVTNFGIHNESAVFDFGCGVGRLALGLCERFPKIKYVGLDVEKRAIAWCENVYAVLYPNTKFIHVDWFNARYNPLGKVDDLTFELPAEMKDSFDAVYGYSVFTHLTSVDIKCYLKWFNFILKPKGNVFVTMFLEKDVPFEEENPPDYPPRYKKGHFGPLHRVRYNIDNMTEIFDVFGFKVLRYEHQKEWNMQTGVYLEKI